MSIIDKLKEDLVNDSKVAEAKLSTTEGRKWVKYGIYIVVALIVLSIGSCIIRTMFGGTSHRVSQNIDRLPITTQQYPQPQVVQQSSGITTGEVLAVGGAGLLGYYIGQKMSNGQVYDGHNAPTKVVNNHIYYVKPDGSTVDKSTVDKTPVVAVDKAKLLTPAEQKSLDQKAIKASADKVAEADKVKMKAEQAEKDRQEKLKADLRAKQAQRASSPVQSKPSGFKAMSKSVTKSNTTSKRK